MSETGIVKKTEGAYARVLVMRKASCCENCGKDSCDVPEQGVETEALNTIGAVKGQTVRVAMRPQTYYKGAMLIYILPVAALIGGAIAGQVYLPSLFDVQDTELMAAAGGFGAFFVSLIIVKLLAGISGKKKVNSPVIESIVEA